MGFNRPIGCNYDHGIDALHDKNNLNPLHKKALTNNVAAFFIYLPDLISRLEIG